MKKEVNKKWFIIKVILLFTLIGANAFAFYRLKQKEKPIKDDTENIKVTSKEPEELEYKNTWIYNNQSYTFDDNTFTYYENIYEYYEGTYEYLKGEKALEEMGYTEEDIIDNFGTGINKENLYSMKLKPTKRVIRDVDKSKTIKENTTWWFILILKDEDNAIGYNKTLDEKYDLAKMVVK